MVIKGPSRELREIDQSTCLCYRIVLSRVIVGKTRGMKMIMLQAQPFIERYSFS